MAKARRSQTAQIYRLLDTPIAFKKKNVALIKGLNNKKNPQCVGIFSNSLA
jgi:hypothetical protein